MSDSPDIASKTPQSDTTFLVAEIEIDELFGRYSYRISPLTPEEAKRGAPPLMLLYGQNGSGKTTIIRLLYHLLSPSEGQEHRTRIAQTAFRRFSVRLGSGDVITVTKNSELIGAFDIKVVNGKKQKAIQKYSYDSQAGANPIQEAKDFDKLFTTGNLQVAGSRFRFVPLTAEEEDRYIEYLEGLGVRPILLTDDRQIYSDDYTELADRRRRERQRATEIGSRYPEYESSPVAAELSDAIRRTNDWLRRQLFTGAEAGSNDADQIYRNVLTQIAGAGAAENTTSLKDVREALENLDSRTRRFSEFGLTPHVTARSFARVLNRIEKLDEASQMLAASVLGPYIEGQNARLNSLQEVEALIRTFLNNLQNYFAPEKRVIFSPQYGLRVFIGDHVYLSPRQLSSGERQLFLLLCNSILARESAGGLFLIDEPELSLNASWQRKLVGSLLACASGANVQFIMASHSIEIITRHRQYLATLTPEDR